MYAETFEKDRRLNPSLFDPDYCLLRGLRGEIERFAKSNRSRKIIGDYGCGGRPYEQFFPKADHQYIGIDTNNNPLADVLIEKDQCVPLEDNFFDAIISTQVFYLIPEYDFYLSEIRRLLKKDGRLFITTHGVWTYHPASGGDYYRFTHDGLKYVLEKHGFCVETVAPIIGTLGAGLHLRQLVLDSAMRRIPIAGPFLRRTMNFFFNIRILAEDALTPHGAKMSCAVIYAAVARPAR